MPRVLIAALAILLSLPRIALADGPWPELREIIFGDAPILESNVVTLSTSGRAQLAAQMLVEISMNTPTGLTITKLTLLIDRNPAPVVAEFELTPYAA